MTLTTQAKRADRLFPIFIVLLTFAMMCMFMYDPLFISDEEEIFNKGQAIVLGETLYSDIGSQHMPLMYYIAAAFALVGADTVVKFRLCFYALLALLWGLIAHRYSKSFGKTVVAVTPLLFLSILPTISSATCILSEQMQAVGMVILGLELLQFRPHKPLTTGSCLMISLAIFLSFGSAFVSIFAIFAVGLTVISLEIAACVKEKRGILKSVGHLIGRYWKLVLIVAAPFAVMLGYFAVMGALKDFYGWAYVINRVIYPKYLDGYGSHIFGSLISGIQTVLAPLLDFEITYAKLMWVGVLLLAAIGVSRIHQGYKRGILTAGLIFFLITAATRDCFGFHGVPALAVLALFASFAVQGIAAHLKACPQTDYTKRGIAAFAALAVVAAFLSNAVDTASKPLSWITDNEVSALSQAVDSLTEDGEPVGFSVMHYEVLISSHTIPASVTGGSCPWLWEYAGEQAMQELTDEPPRVFLLNKEQTTWSYKITDYAADLIDFVETNYTSLDDYGYGQLYIRNDYYSQALVTLGFA